jgi:hypothetical protein
LHFLTQYHYFLSQHLLLMSQLLHLLVHLLHLAVHVVHLRVLKGNIYSCLELLQSRKSSQSSLCSICSPKPSSHAPPSTSRYRSSIARTAKSVFQGC